ncbi:MAG: hypothetical protein M3P08_08320 [Thermoproteota archaeon]|nr:hypothetical protein [Thermoproteota archaeon]
MYHYGQTIKIKDCIKIVRTQRCRRCYRANVVRFNLLGFARNIMEKREKKSRIFVSCGQKDEKEKLIAYQLERGLTELGFEPYVAVHEQSTISIIQNILPHLRDSEYFLFVDFRRERLMARGEEYRGSLFTNQELAIAIYLNKEIIAFQEEEIKKLDGMISAILANAIRFNEKERVVDKIIAEVGKKWITNWRNELIVEDKKTKGIEYDVVNYRRRTDEPSRP